MTRTSDEPSKGEAHFRALERVYLDSPTNEYYQPEIRIEPDRARITIEVRPDLFHAAGAIHGSHVFKVLDDAAFFAASSRNDEVFLLTTGFTIQLMRPVSSGQLVASGQVIQATRRVIWAESRVHDDQGRLVGTGSGSFLPSRIALTPEIGYR